MKKDEHLFPVSLAGATRLMGGLYGLARACKAWNRSRAFLKAAITLVLITDLAISAHNLKTRQHETHH